MKRFFLTLTLLIGLLSCQRTPNETTNTNEIPGKMKHIVFFWLKNPDSANDRAAFETAIQKLMDENPQKVVSYLGTPAPTENRDVVDQSYTYCYIMTFPSVEAQEAYQTDPTHTRFVDEASHLWEKVVVYDAVP